MNNNLRITQLKLSNYRNHNFLQINPNKNIVLISGKNGSGKTNILESISLLNSNTGFRNASLFELIRTKLVGPTELFGVNLNLCNGSELVDVGIGIKKKMNVFSKIISYNKKRNNNPKNNFNTFWVLPQMSHLLQGAPEDRRNFMDLMISPDLIPALAAGPLES